MELPPYEWTAYRARLRDEFAAGWISRGERDVLIAIANINMAGDNEPTVAKIAAEAGCARRTVQRARAIAEERGLLDVEARFCDGWRGANRYTLTLPPGRVTMKPAKIRGRQKVRTRDKKKEEKRQTRVVVAAESLDAIARRRMATLGLGPRG